MITIQELIDKLNWFDFLRKIKVILTGLNNKASFADLQVFASNAAAITGGLSVNDLYRTAGGEIRIVVAA